MGQDLITTEQDEDGEFVVADNASDETLDQIAQEILDEQKKTAPAISD